MLITIVAGARPNFMKISPIIKAIDTARSAGKDIDYQLVHTGQHSDYNMSGVFFEQIGIPEPTINLAVSGGTHAEQTASIMVGFEKFLMSNPSDIVLVVGDVNSTMACAIVAKKLQAQLVHVEVGISSGDMTMPEEINRTITASIADHYFTTTEAASASLLKTGIDPSRVHLVGSTMIDSLLGNKAKARQPDVWQKSNLQSGQYYLTTLHRPSNVDDPKRLASMLDAMSRSAGDLPVIFPVHPRTRHSLESIQYQHDGIVRIEPAGYLEFIYLLQHAKAVLTDSGGIAEESSTLGVPCMFLRDTTERPEVFDHGTAELVGTNPDDLQAYFDKLARGEWKQPASLSEWDGHAATRIVSELLAIYG